ncbi:MAG: hypothetical protein D6E12_08880 [Desulfovibrio sp.]|nr:MAG: hypothetical protein D6E12_08880 [Desulfovibrio sp.]
MAEFPFLVLEIGRDAAYVPVAAMAARTVAQQAGFGAKDAQAVSLAVEEGVANAAFLDFQDPRGRITVRMEQAGKGLQVTITSKGLPLDVEQLPGFDPDRAMRDGDAPGLGLLLMKGMMDRVRFEAEPGGARCITMLKYSPGPPLGEVRPFREPEPGFPAGSIDFTVRPLQPEEAESVALMAFRSHGGLMFSEHIYYPERIRAMNQSGEMASAVAVSPEHGVMGHGAVVFLAPESQVGELTYGIVDERFRRQGCATALARHLKDLSRGQGVLALYSFAVTHHAFSQKAALKQGFLESGLLLSASPGSRIRGGGDKDAPERIHNFILVKYLGKWRKETLYPPARHRDMIRRIYERFGLEADYAEAGSWTPPQEETRLVLFTDQIEGWLFMSVAQFGHDVVEQVRRCLEQARGNAVTSIVLVLPLGDPSTAVLCPEFEAMGFFFAGVGPDNNGRESLQLQYIHDSPTRYGEIQAASEFGQELKEYIRAQDPRPLP